MIKFFRRIRRQLLTENKFSKYLLYAIGEIVLVVVGILIALSINNWNEDKKKEEQLVSSYYLILGEVDYYVENLNRRIDLIDLQITQNKNSLNLLKNKNLDSMIKLKENLRGVTDLTSLKVDMPVTTSFIKKDYVENIDNTNLMSTLLKLEGLLSFLSDQQLFASNQYQLLIEPYIIENLNYSQIYPQSYYVDVDENFDYSKLSELSKFANILNIKLETDVVGKNILDQLIQIIKKLEQEIRLELENIE